MALVNRRSFLNAFSALSAGTLFSSFSNATEQKNLDKAMLIAGSRSPEQLAGDEDFWYYIQQCYAGSPNLVNLNNGGVAPSPKSVQEAMKRYYDFSNEAPSYFMWRELDKGREPLRNNLAAAAGCDPEELAFQRNASEALETVIFGLNLKAGDEVVLTKQDYPNMIEAWKQREQRDGIKLVWVNLDLPSEDNEYMANAYIKAFTPKTKLVHVTHVINWNGQIIPVRKIADAAHARGIEVLVDGAHSFAQFQFSVPELGADYFGTSLHKWLSACIGSGFLYVKKEKIKDLYPLFASPVNEWGNIRKFEHQGTRPFFIEQAIGKALEFYDMVGPQRKEQRLLYLKNYWMNKVKDLPGIRIGTSLKAGFGCAIGIVHAEGRKPSEMEAHLLYRFRVHTTPIEWENIKGIRVTPNVYTTTKNLDLLVTGIKDYLKTQPTVTK